MNNPTDRPAQYDAAVEVSRVIKAPRPSVFDAWIQPDLKKQWWACGPCDINESDPTVGGEFTIGTHDRGDGQAFIATGMYQRIEPYDYLEYTWTWLKPADFVEDSLVCIRFEDANPGTRVTVTHRRFATQDLADPHADGWERGLEALAQLLET